MGTLLRGEIALLKGGSAVMGSISGIRRRRTRQRRGFTLVELLIVIAITIFLLSMIVPPFYFPITMLGIAGVVCVIAFVALVVRRRTRLASIGPLVALAALLVPTYWALAKLSPLYSIQVAEASFTNKPLVDVLQSLASQRRDFPRLRFRVATSALARQYISVDIPEGARLEEAIERTADAAGCDYEWRWWNGHLAVLVILHPQDAAADIDSDSMVRVYDDGIIWPE